MSKGKAVISAIIALLIGCLFLPAQLYGCFWPFLLIALFYACVAYYKHQRDQRLMQRPYEDHEQSDREQAVLPPMTSKGSNRLFVPPHCKEVSKLCHSFHPST